MAAGCLIFIGFQKRASVEQLLEKVPPSSDGVDCLCDVSTEIDGICIHYCSGCFVIHPDRLLEKQTAAFKIFTNPKVVYIGLISTALSMALGSYQSLDYWHHWWSVPSSRPDAGSGGCFIDGSRHHYARAPGLKAMEDLSSWWWSIVTLLEDWLLLANHKRKIVLGIDAP